MAVLREHAHCGKQRKASYVQGVSGGIETRVNGPFAQQMVRKSRGVIVDQTSFVERLKQFYGIGAKNNVRAGMNAPFKERSHFRMNIEIKVVAKVRGSKKRPFLPPTRIQLRQQAPRVFFAFPPFRFQKVIFRTKTLFVNFCQNLFQLSTFSSCFKAVWSVFSNKTEKRFRVNTPDLIV